MAEWLRRVPAKYMGFPRESSNLSGVVLFQIFLLSVCGKGFVFAVLCFVLGCLYFLSGTMSSMQLPSTSFGMGKGLSYLPHSMVSVLLLLACRPL